MRKPDHNNRSRYLEEDSGHREGGKGTLGENPEKIRRVGQCRFESQQHPLTVKSDLREIFFSSNLLLLLKYRAKHINGIG